MTYEPKSRVLRVTLTVAVRDMTEMEYADAMDVSVGDDIEGFEGDPRDVVSFLRPAEFSELIEGALESEANPDLFAGTGIFAVMGAAGVESIEWVE